MDSREPSPARQRLVSSVQAPAQGRGQAKAEFPLGRDVAGFAGAGIASFLGFRGEGSQGADARNAHGAALLEFPFHLPKDDSDRHFGLRFSHVHSRYVCMRGYQY